MQRRFRHIVSGEECGRGQPDPEIFLRAAQLLEVPPADCIVIEDSINGLKAARAAGAFAIGITHTFSSDMLAPHADWVVASLQELRVDALAERAAGKSHSLS